MFPIKNTLNKSWNKPWIFRIWRRYHEKLDFPETTYSIPPPPHTHTHTHTFEEKYLITKCIEEFYKLLNYFLILCVTLYTTNHVLFYNRDAVFERELFQNGYKQ